MASVMTGLEEGVFEHFVVDHLSPLGILEHSAVSTLYRMRPRDTFEYSVFRPPLTGSRLLRDHPGYHTSNKLERKYLADFE